MTNSRDLANLGGGFIQAGGGVQRSVESKLQDSVSVLDFIPPGTDTANTDCTGYIQAAMDAAAGKTLFVPKGSYKLTNGVDLSGSLEADDAVFVFHGATGKTGSGVTNYLLLHKAEGSIRGLTVDGANVTSCQYGIFVDTSDYAQKQSRFYEVSVLNISNTDASQTCMGLVIYKSAGSVHLENNFYIKSNVENVLAAEAVAKGISVSFNATGCDATIHIDGCRISNISSGVVTPALDSDGIHVLQADYASATAKGNVLISNCSTFDCKKRGFKVQMPNTQLVNCVNRGGSLSEDFSSYSHRTSFVGCHSIDSGAVGFSINEDDAVVSGCTAKSASTSSTLFVSTDASRCKIADSIFVSTGALAADSGVVELNSPSFTLTNSSITGLNSTTGVGIRMNGVGLVSGVDIKTVGRGIDFRFNSGIVRISNTNITSAGIGIQRIGGVGLTAFLDNCYIDTSNTAVYLFYSTNETIAYIDNCYIAGSNGILCSSKSVITDSEIVNSTTTGTAIQCLDDFTVRGNVIRNFSVGVNYNYTTTAVVANNVCIGTTTPFSKIGYAAFVDHDNYSR